jgi:amidophosphoribosyltransferase
MPTEESRTYALRLKLNPITCEIKNKKILLLDDSIVRGATLKRVAALLKSSAKEIHLAIHCPPVIHPCFYGIDMSVEEDLVAYKIAKKLGLNIKNALSIEEQRILEKEMAKILEVNSLTFLSIQGLSNVFGDNKCSACFDAYYPVEITDNLVSEIRKDRMCKEKVRS